MCDMGASLQLSIPIGTHSNGRDPRACQSSASGLDAIPPQHLTSTWPERKRCWAGHSSMHDTHPDASWAFAGHASLSADSSNTPDSHVDRRSHCACVCVHRSSERVRNVNPMAGAPTRNWTPVNDRPSGQESRVTDRPTDRPTDRSTGLLSDWLGARCQALSKCSN